MLLFAMMTTAEQPDQKHSKKSMRKVGAKVTQVPEMASWSKQHLRINFHPNLRNKRVSLDYGSNSNTW